MNGITSFDSTKESLQDILRNIETGNIQLPDFQRGWIWDDDRVKSLLASISLSYPIGAIMFLQTGADGVTFKPRPVEGVDVLPNSKEPERLILDGQQRLTSLFQSLFSEKYVRTKDSRGKALKRRYYINIQEALNPQADREEAIVSIPEDRKVRSFRGEVSADYSTPELEYQTGMFPLNQILNSSNWRLNHNEFWDFDRDKIRLFDAFEHAVIERFKQYDIPIIVLRSEIPKAAVCQVFEKVNTGGVSLTVFELLTATFAAEDFNLREDWETRQAQLKSNRVLARIGTNDFLQALTLLATHERRTESLAAVRSAGEVPGVSCKRKDILELTLREYKVWADRVMDGFERAARLLYSENIFTARDLPYQTQLSPLAAIFALLGDKADLAGVRSQIVQWYWCGVLGELYGSAVESRFARDLVEVISWVDGGPEPSSVADANFVPTRLKTLRTRNSAAYKGLYTLLIRDGGLDFLTGEPIDNQMYFDQSIDIHHIFPERWCKANGVDSARYNSIVNKTPLAARTNRIIGGRAPSQYIPIIQRNAGVDEIKMFQILRSHVVDPQSLLADDFDQFWNARENSLIERIENAMGKPVLRETAESESEAEFYEDEEEVA